MNAIRIQQATGLKTADLQGEIVERKGLGHPDSMCDAIMESVSLALAQTYIERAGTVLHYNCDKAMLVAGRAEVRWGGGEVIEPMRLVMGDRATAAWDGQQIDIGAIAVDAARRWIRAHLRYVDPDRHMRYQVELKPASAALARVYGRGTLPVANDTSAVVGYAPLTETERLVLEAEHYLNGSFKRLFPDTGEDVKVMGVREGRRLHLTVAMPLLDRALHDERTYFDRIDEIREVLQTHLRSTLQHLDDVSLTVNALDRPGEGLAGIYASVLGISAENADSGEVGRGNRVNGLIAFCRPAGSEAAAGKNAVGHVGKIYNVLAQRLAERIVENVPGVEETTLWLVSDIGQRLDQPRVVMAAPHLAPGVAIDDVSQAIQSIVAAELARLPAFCRELAAGVYSVV